MQFFFIALLFLYGFCATAAEINLNVPVMVTIEDENLGLRMQSFPVACGALQQFEPAFACVADLNNAAVSLMINRKSMVSLIYLKNLIVVAQDVYKKKSTDGVSWEERDMLDYLSLADQFSANEELQKVILKRGPNKLVDQLKPYILDIYAKPTARLIPEQERKIDEGCAKIIFPQVLTLCTNAETKKFWHGYFYEKQYRNKEFELLRSAPLKLDTLREQSEWQDWKKSFEQQTFLATCDNDECTLLEDLLLVERSMYDIYHYTKNYTHLPLCLMYIKAYGMYTQLNFNDNNIMMCDVDWHAIAHFTSAKKSMVEITLFIPDLSHVPWHLLQSLDKQEGSPPISFIIKTPKSALRLPQNMWNKALKLHPMTSDRFYFLAAGLIYHFCVGMTLSSYFDDVTAYTKAIKVMVDTIAPETCSIIQKLVKADQSLLPGVHLSLSKHTRPFITLAAQQCMQEPLISLPSIQTALCALKKVNHIASASIVGLNFTTMTIAYAFVVPFWLLLVGYAGYQITKTHVVPDGRGGLRFRRAWSICPELFFDKKKGCTIVIEPIDIVNVAE